MLCHGSVSLSRIAPYPLVGLPSPALSDSSARLTMKKIDPVNTARADEDLDSDVDRAQDLDSSHMLDNIEKAMTELGVVPAENDLANHLVIGAQFMDLIGTATDAFRREVQSSISAGGQESELKWLLTDLEGWRDQSKAEIGYKCNAF